MTTTTYRLADEPSLQGLVRWAVDPLWPFFAIMFGGAFVSWPWFLVNAFAVGSPTRRREAITVAIGFLGSFVALAVLFKLDGLGLISARVVPYALLPILVWKLAITYWLYTLQARTFELFRHFGGSVRNGLPVLIAGFFLGPKLLRSLPIFWALWLQ